MYMWCLKMSAMLRSQGSKCVGGVEKYACVCLRMSKMYKRWVCVYVGVGAWLLVNGRLWFGCSKGPHLGCFSFKTHKTLVIVCFSDLWWEECESLSLNQC